MNIETDDESLVELIENGKTSNKRYKKLPIAAIKGFQKAIFYMRSSSNIEMLKRINGLHYEKLKGNLNGYESVRCNNVWRLIFKSYAKEGSIVITEVKLIEISHHYE